MSVMQTAAQKHAELWPGTSWRSDWRQFSPSWNKFTFDNLHQLKNLYHMFGTTCWLVDYW